MFLKTFKECEPDLQEEVILYVGEEFSRSYQKKWESMDKRSSKKSWNWAAFFFLTLWAAYRRMYGLAFGVFGIQSVLTLIFLLGFRQTDDSPILNLLILAIDIVLWVSANHLYQQHAIKAVEKLRIKFPERDKRIAQLQKLSGGSVGSVCLLLGVSFVFGGIYLLLVVAMLLG